LSVNALQEIYKRLIRDRCTESGFLYSFLSIVDIDNTTQIHDIYTISNLFNHRNVYINQPQNLIMTELLIPYECQAL